ncbi:MAG: acetate kinase, partial [Alphaproteobacteria bacterium HGW-Alphaproteobacteria-6]
MARDLILVVNAGSSSIKAALFDDGPAAVAAGTVTEIGGVARLKAGAA